MLGEKRCGTSTFAAMVISANSKSRPLEGSVARREKRIQDTEDTKVRQARCI